MTIPLTLLNRVKDYVGDIADDEAITSWLMSGARLLINRLSIGKLISNAIKGNIIPPNGFLVRDSRILHVLLNLNSPVPASEVPVSFVGKLTDTNSIHQATSLDPRYVIDAGYVKLFPITQPTFTELIQNPDNRGFESGTSNWDHVGSVNTFSITSVAPLQGIYSGLITASQSGDRSNGYVRLHKDHYGPLVIDQIYSLSLIANSNTPNIQLNIAFGDSGSSFKSDALQYSGTGPVHSGQVIFTFTARANDVEQELRLFLDLPEQAVNVEVRIDAISIKEAGPATGAIYYIPFPIIDANSTEIPGLDSSYDDVVVLYAAVRAQMRAVNDAIDTLINSSTISYVSQTISNDLSSLITTFQTYLDTNEDIEMARTKLEQHNAQAQKYLQEAQLKLQDAATELQEDTAIIQAGIANVQAQLNLLAVLRQEYLDRLQIALQ